LVVFSDGVSEALNAAGDEFGEDRIVDAIRSAERTDASSTLEALMSAVKQWATGAAQNDDVTALVIRYRG
ncbi:MAG: SpoIIE family protein phosphatase, partial [Vicinamibacterales bacterium]